jgi:hypothetical protein
MNGQLYDVVVTVGGETFGPYEYQFDGSDDRNWLAIQPGKFRVLPSVNNVGTEFWIDFNFFNGDADEYSRFLTHLQNNYTNGVTDVTINISSNKIPCIPVLPQPNCPGITESPTTGYVTSLDGSPISEYCCEDYGYNYSYELTLPFLLWGDTTQAKCFPCPKIMTICDFRFYVININTEFGLDGLVEVLEDEGLFYRDDIKPNLISLYGVDPNQGVEFATALFKKKYINRCLILDDMGNGIKSGECCRMRGGTWIDYSIGGHSCVQTQAS